MKIVLLDTHTLGYDLDFKLFESYGEVVCYPFSSEEEVLQRGKEANVLISNKVQYDRSLLEKLTNLKLICLTSTGTNTVDIEAATELGIVVKNIVGYSTESVAHLTFSLIMKLMTPIDYYDEYVKSGRYIDDTKFSHYETTWSELSGKTFGIVGYGNIGQKVGTIAEAFGCKVIYYSTSGSNTKDINKRVDLDTLLTTSDIISIHAPLNEKTINLFNEETFQKMKPTSMLINMGRGAIVNENGLIKALNNRWIYKAGIDVLKKEPMINNHPMKKLIEKNSLIITPHIGWASIESRRRMLNEVALNIQSFIEGTNHNTVTM